LIESFQCFTLSYQQFQNKEHNCTYLQILPLDAGLQEKETRKIICYKPPRVIFLTISVRIFELYGK